MGQLIAWRFARDYTLIWRRRREALTMGLKRRDRSAALDAVISLRIAAVMIGGARLAHLAEAIQTLVEEGELERGEALLAGLEDYGSATVRELRINYVQMGC